MKKLSIEKIIIGLGIWILISIPMLWIGLSMTYSIPEVITWTFTFPGSIGLVLVPYISLFYCIPVITRRNFDKVDRPLKYHKRARKIAKIAMILNVIMIFGHVYFAQDLFRPPRELRIHQLPVE